MTTKTRREEIADMRERGETFAAIARHLGVTRQAIHQMARTPLIPKEQPVVAPTTHTDVLALSLNACCVESAKRTRDEWPERFAEGGMFRCRWCRTQLMAPPAFIRLASVEQP